MHKILLFCFLIYFSDLSGQDSVYVNYDEVYTWFSEKTGLSNAINISKETYQDSFFILREELLKYASGCGTGMEQIVAGTDTLTNWYTDLDNRFNGLTFGLSLKIESLQEFYKPGIEKLIAEAERKFFEAKGKHVLFYKSASHAFDKTDYFIGFLTVND